MRFCKKLIIIAPMILSMAACVQMDQRPRDHDMDINLQRTAIFIDGKRLNDINAKIEDDEEIGIVDHLINILGGEDEFDDTLRDDFDRLEKQGTLAPELRNFVESLESKEIRYTGELPADALRARLRNIGGLYAIFALKTLTACVIEGKEQLIEPGEQRLVGKIFEYSYNRYTSGGFVGFGAKNILTCEGKKPTEEDYVIHIAVMPIEENEGNHSFKEFSQDENGEFPQSIEDFLPNDPDVRKRIKERGLDHKLYAKGNSIEVIAAFKDEELLPYDHPIYHQDKDACIDILFKGSIPTFELPDKEDYCMGRCGTPPLINTGY